MPPIHRRGLAGLAALPFAARAQETRPVRLIVPYPPGGGTDIVARILLPAVAELPGAPATVIDNRPGAGGDVGTEVLAKSPPILPPSSVTSWPSGRGRSALPISGWNEAAPALWWRQGKTSQEEAACWYRTG